MKFNFSLKFADSENFEEFYSSVPEFPWSLFSENGASFFRFILISLISEFPSHEKVIKIVHE